MVCPKCGSRMKVLAFITDHAVVDRIIDYLKLTFSAEKPPPSRVFEQVALLAVEERQEYFLDEWFLRGGIYSLFDAFMAGRCVDPARQLLSWEIFCS